MFRLGFHPQDTLYVKTVFQNNNRKEHLKSETLLGPSIMDKGCSGPASFLSSVVLSKWFWQHIWRFTSTGFGTGVLFFSFFLENLGLIRVGIRPKKRPTRYYLVTIKSAWTSRGRGQTDRCSRCSVTRVHSSTACHTCLPGGCNKPVSGELNRTDTQLASCTLRQQAVLTICLHVAGKHCLKTAREMQFK